MSVDIEKKRSEETKSVLKKRRSYSKKKKKPESIENKIADDPVKVVSEKKPLPPRKKKDKPEVKKIHTPFELFYDEGLSKTGWAGLLRPLFDEVKRWNEKSDFQFQFSQIKEKWGSLQLYNFGATEEQWKRIKMCEKASNHICMYCGSPFRVGRSTDGWITTMCRVCADKQNLVGDFKLYEYKNKEDKIINIIATNKIEAQKKLLEKIADIDVYKFKYKLSLNKSSSSKPLSAKEIYDKYEPLTQSELEYHAKKYKLIDCSKYNGWVEIYDSVRITPIIKIALKLQKFGFYCDRKMDSIWYFSRLRWGYVRFFFTHYVLRSNKLDRTMFNYKKYK